MFNAVNVSNYIYMFFSKYLFQSYYFFNKISGCILFDLAIIKSGYKRGPEAIFS